jgi:L-ribulokinase
MAFTIGIDFGTNSVRAVVVDCSDGREIGSCVIDYPSGKRGVLLDPRDPDLARQHPGDYFYGWQRSVSGALNAASSVADRAADRGPVMKELIQIRERQAR